MSSTTLNGASEVFTSTATANGNPPPTTQQSTSSPKEIGWWFVESYYTTLNGSPERLHLFYQKKSSFVWGIEGENVAVSHGRNEISERIKQLAFNDCKVRVTNVDSQGSLESGIIVQVLGDMINNSESSQRFAQTFFLAEQTNPRGYFVLNDIFRYLKEEEEEETAEAVPEETVEAPVEPALEAEPVVVEEKEPEVEAKEEPEEPEPVPVVEKEEVKEEVKEEEVKEETEKIEEAPVEPEAEKVEEPAAVAPVIPAVPVVPAVPVIPTPQPETSEPEPTPEAPPAVTEPVKETPQAPPPVPQEPPKPAKPASWAALLASKTPAAPTAPVATQPVAPAAPPTNTPAANTNTNAPAPTPSASTTAPGPSSQANSGWQTTESRRQNRPVSMSGATQNAGSAYVKNVNEKVSHKDLKAALEKFGTVNNVEIVLERKCAFVEFADGAALLAAAKENPHRINGQIIYVEERRPRPANYGGPRGGGSNLRGGERQGSRGGSQRGPGDRDRFDTNRNSIGGGRGQGGNVRGGGQYPRGGRGGAAASSN